VNRGAARMDYAKLTSLNGVYIRKADDDRLTQEVRERLAGRPGLTLHEDAVGRIRALMPHLKERAKTLVELADSSEFLARTVPLPMAAKATALLVPEAREMLRALGDALAKTDFSPAALEQALRGFAEATGRKLGQVAQPLRAALTGSMVSPGIEATLAALGREEALRRIEAVAGYAGPPPVGTPVAGNSPNVNQWPLSGSWYRTRRQDAGARPEHPPVSRTPAHGSRGCAAACPRTGRIDADHANVAHGSG